MSCCWFMSCRSERDVGVPAGYSAHHPGTSRSLRAVMLAHSMPDWAGADRLHERRSRHRPSQRDVIARHSVT